MSITYDRASQIFILDSMRFSFSSASAYNTCPRMFRLSYLDGDVHKINNAFAQYGSLCHSILERYYRGEIELFDLPGKYKEEYPVAISEPFPPSKGDMNANYYNAGLQYFATFADPWKNMQVLAVEEKFRGKLCGAYFVGIIDLVLQDPNTGEIWIVDHKSKAKFKSRTEKAEYLRQLYLYSLYVKKKYGKYPTKLIFNMFRVGEVDINDFVMEDLGKSIQWFRQTIRSIYKDNKYPLKPKEKTRDGKPVQWDFFCNNICSVRHECPRSIACARHK